MILFIFCKVKESGLLYVWLNKHASLNVKFSEFSGNFPSNLLDQELGSRWMSAELICYVKIIIVFYKFYDLFCMRHSWMNRPCYNNSFQCIQHNNFRNLNRVIFTHWKNLRSRVNVFWYCFSVIKRYTFHYLMKLARILGNQSSLEILLLFDIWPCQKLVILFFNFVVILI